MSPLAAESPPNASASTIKTVGGDGHAEEPPQPKGNRPLGSVPRLLVVPLRPPLLWRLLRGGIIATFATL
eukprot:7750462-Pyramimonas_sp.AAC.1